VALTWLCAGPASAAPGPARPAAAARVSTGAAPALAPRKEAAAPAAASPARPAGTTAAQAKAMNEQARPA
jgi:hypothetical protein